MISTRSKITVIFILGVTFSLLYMFTQTLVVDSFQLLERGYLFTQGYLVPFGPRSTNTNLIYGPFISIFTGVSLWIWNTPLSVLFGILLFHILGFYFLLKTKFLQINQSFYLVYLILYWCSPWRANEVFIWNPAFLMTVSSMYLFSLGQMFEKKYFSGTLLLGISLIWCFSIHNSFVFLGVLTLILLGRKQIKFDLKAVLFCIIIFIVYLSPTLITIYQKPQVLSLNTGGESYLFRNLVHFGEALKGILYWLRYSSLYFGSTNFKVQSFEKESFNLIWNGVKWALAIASLFLILRFNFKFFKSNETPKRLKILTSSAFFALVIVSCISPASFNYWHLYLIYPFCLMPVAHELNLSLHKNKIMTGLLVYFLIFVTITSYKSEEHSWNSKITEDYHHRLSGKKALIDNYRPMILELGK